MKNDFKGTPGEWGWEENSASDINGSTCIEIYADGPQIAYLQSFPSWDGCASREVTIANANLIVTAPQLLDVLKVLINAIDSGTQMDVINAVDDGRVAIARALGEN